MKELKPGIRGKEELLVTKENTASALGSGLLEVFATPAMIALMENTATNSVQPYLDEGEGSVGSSISVKHLAATAVGKKVTCESELIAVDRKRLTFSVKAFDEAGLIGEGEHERFVINNAPFMEKAAKRGTESLT